MVSLLSVIWKKWTCFFCLLFFFANRIKREEKEWCQFLPSVVVVVAVVWWVGYWAFVCPHGKKCKLLCWNRLHGRIAFFAVFPWTNKVNANAKMPMSMPISCSRTRFSTSRALSLTPQSCRAAPSERHSTALFWACWSVWNAAEWWRNSRMPRSTNTCPISRQRLWIDSETTSTTHW